MPAPSPISPPTSSASSWTVSGANWRKSAGGRVTTRSWRESPHKPQRQPQQPDDEQGNAQPDDQIEKAALAPRDDLTRRLELRQRSKDRPEGRPPQHRAAPPRRR